MKHNLYRQKGQALILIVAAIVGLIGLTALAIDGGNAFSDRRHAQSAADAAALAAALAKVNNQNWTAAALARAADNGYTNDGVRSTVTISSPPGPDCDGATPNPLNPAVDPADKIEYYIQVVIHSNVDTYFAPIVGVDQIHNCVQAIARAKSSVVKPLVFGNALASLDQHACSAMWSHGSAVTNVVGSGIFVNSDCSSSAFLQSGNALMASAAICVVGGATYDSSDVAPPPQTGCGPQMPYPPEYIWPTPSCPASGTKVGNTLTPGNVPGSWIAGDVTLQPGTYCISGDVSINSQDHITGYGVLLYLINGGLHINGGAEIILSAQTSGDFAGLLIYLPITNSSSVIMNGNGNSMFTGTVLAPASAIQVNGTNSPYGYHSQFIGRTVDLSGTADTYIVYYDNENFDITLPPTIELTR